MSKFLSRKFLLHVTALIIGTVALFMGYLAGGEWVMLVSVLGGSYGLSNAAWHYADTRVPAGWQPTGKHLD